MVDVTVPAPWTVKQPAGSYLVARGRCLAAGCLASGRVL